MCLHGFLLLWSYSSASGMHVFSKNVKMLILSYSQGVWVYSTSSFD